MKYIKIELDSEGLDVAVIDVENNDFVILANRGTPHELDGVTFTTDEHKIINDFKELVTNTVNKLDYEPE